MLSTVLPHSVSACSRPWTTCGRYCPTTASAASRLCPSLKNSSRPARSPRVKTTRRRKSPGGVVGSPRSRPGHSAREASVSAPAHLPELEEEGGRGERGERAGAGEAGAGNFLAAKGAEPREEDFMRNKAAPVFHSSNHVLVPCEFCHTGPGVSEAELLECLYRVGRQVPGQRLRLDGVAPCGPSSAS